MSTTPPQKKRKLSPPLADDTASTNPSSSTPSPSPSTLPTERASRFAALKSRAVASSRANLAETAAEAKRDSINPTALSNLSRKAAVAQHNLLKTDTEEEGGKGAFERKRAWDYTIEESEKWDERIGKKRDARSKNSFQDYGSEAGKIYERQIAQLEKSVRRGKDGGGGDLNREEYERQKQELIEKAARSGGLEVVELDNGETVAIDSNGTFYADVESVGFVEQKPKRENVDRLVADLRKAEDVRLKKRKERRGADAVEEGDVTYINDKNKQFNMKLGRFYDRYTKDIKESFERGTAM